MQTFILKETEVGNDTEGTHPTLQEGVMDMNSHTLFLYLKAIKEKKRKAKIQQVFKNFYK